MLSFGDQVRNCGIMGDWRGSAPICKRKSCLPSELTLIWKLGSFYFLHVFFFNAALFQWSTAVSRNFWRMVSSLTLTLFMEQKPLTGAAEASDLSMETHLKSAQGPVYGADESQSAKVFIHPYILILASHFFKRCLMKMLSKDLMHSQPTSFKTTKWPQTKWYNKRHHFLAQFSIPFHMACFAFLRVLA